MGNAQLPAEFDKLIKSGFDDIQMMAFEACIVDSNDYRLYYDYLIKFWDLPDDAKENMRFDTFGGQFYNINDKNVFPFLLEKAQESREKGRLLYLIAQNLSRVENSDYDIYRDNLTVLLTELTESKDAEDRRRGLIALGWAGNEGCISNMSEHMQHDEDALCRAWAASGLMQLSFHRVSKETVASMSLDSFLKAIEIESDIFALGVMVRSAQELCSKKWISGSAVENRDEGKIQKARKSAVSFIKKQV